MNISVMFMHNKYNMLKFISQAARYVVASLLWVFICTTGASASCNEPTGLEELPSDVRNKLTTVLGPGGLPYLFVILTDPLINAVASELETPVQFRVAQIHGSVCYNAAAKYHSSALDIWGHDTNRICSNNVDADYRKLHEELTSAYTFYLSAITHVVPEIEDTLGPIMREFGLDTALLDIDPPDPSTPWGLSKILVNEFVPFLESDGWNADGSLTRKYNKLPYSDFSIVGSNGVAYNPYVVDTDPYVEPERQGKFDPWSWQPLIDSDKKGYFTKQEYVTPHVGFTGRLYGMTKSHYESFTTPPPNYKYKQEGRRVLKETRFMASDDLKKMLIQYFDSKFTSILLLQIDYSVRSDLDLFEFWWYDMILVNAMYNALLLVWREKVVYNEVRPTTVIHELFDEEEVLSYAGPFQGSKTIIANEWQPFIRTMPHAEYPSGSACICTAFAEAMKQITGKDDIGITLSKDFEAGSSKTEPDVTPKQKITLNYNKWSDIALDCGESRLYGGMHFQAAVPAGHDLCSSDFVRPVVDHARLLKDGNPTGLLAAYDDDQIIVTRKR
mmetsp:Transcript_42003/g.88149  ORF Transcript_42003/g.88149 Transcript_42003/m.88149 type:complete len:557 (-) Transcript_42003:353-2023(-)